jgi:hypothetical protein
MNKSAGKPAKRQPYQTAVFLLFNKEGDFVSSATPGIQKSRPKIHNKSFIIALG